MGRDYLAILPRERQPMKTMTDRELVAALIEPDPYHPGPMDVVVRERHIPVWALVNYIVAAEGDIDQTAAAYNISTDAVRAAITYYKDHKEIIEARLEANEV
jgi:uncharacterized protein (DUF433 family)